MEARDNQGIGGKEPGWALGLEDNLRNCVASRGQAEHLAVAKFELLWWWGRGHSEYFGI